MSSHETQPELSEPERPAADDARVSIQVNGEPREVAAGATVAALVAELGLAGSRRLAVAVNRAVVPRSAHARHALAAGDRVEILEAVGGG